MTAFAVFLSLLAMSSGSSAHAAGKCESILAHSAGRPSNAPTDESASSEKTSLRVLKGLSVLNQKVDVNIAEYAALVQPEAGTVLYMCGGPKACIAGRPSNVPDNVKVVAFDYLGLGKNSSLDRRPDLMSIEAQGAVAAEMVERLKLSDYVIYGQSYGSAVATIAASKIAENPGRAQPRSIVLEGVFGAKKTNIRDWSSVSKRTWKLLSEEDRSKYRNFVGRFKAQNPSLAGEFDERVFGLLWQGPRAAAEQIREKSRLPLEERIANAKKAIESSPRNLSGSEGPYYSAGACQLIQHNDSQAEDAKFLFEDRFIVNTYRDAESSLCGCRTVPRDYDPKEYAIKAPIIYLNGDGDPGSPLAGAKSHFDSQSKSKAKALVVVKDGGHGNTWDALAPCVSRIYSAAFSGQPEKITALESLSQQREANCGSSSRSSPAAVAR